MRASFVFNVKREPLSLECSGLTNYKPCPHMEECRAVTLCDRGKCKGVFDFGHIEWCKRDYEEYVKGSRE